MQHHELCVNNLTVNCSVKMELPVLLPPCCWIRFFVTQIFSLPEFLSVGISYTANKIIGFTADLAALLYVTARTLYKRKYNKTFVIRKVKVLKRAVTINKTGNVAYSNTETRWFNHCCNGNAISITYSESVFVDLGVQQAMCMRYFAVCDLPDCTVFFHTIS